MAAERLRSLATAVVVAAPFAVGWGVGASDEGAPQGDVVTTFVDPEVVESSGLVVTQDRVLTTNDSGDEGRVFVVDPTTGRTVGVTRWSEDPTDVEALAPAGRDAVWVADIGDNAGSRDTVEVARVPVGDRDVTVDASPTTLVYDGPGRDAEALVAHPRSGRLFVLTKGVMAGEAWAVPAGVAPGAAYRMTRVGRLPGMVTDASFLPDGRHVLVRTYSRALLLAFPSWEVRDSWRLPDQPQGEGLAVSPDGRILLSSEGVNQPLLRVRPPARVRRLLESRSRPEATAPRPGRGAEGSAGSGTRAVDTLPDMATEAADRDATQWLMGGALALLVVLVLVRSVRPPR